MNEVKDDTVIVKFCSDLAIIADWLQSSFTLRNCKDSVYQLGVSLVY